MSVRRQRRRPVSRTIASFVTVAIVACVTFASRSVRADVGECVAAAERAQQRRDEAKYGAARSELLVCGREVCPALVRRDCMRWLTELNEASPSIVVRARDARGADLEAVSVRVDGEVITERIDGRAIFVDPGAHVVRAQVAGGKAVEQKVIIQTGEKNRLIELTLADAPPGPERSENPHDDGRHYGALPWIAGGVGVASLGVAAFFGATALSDRSDFKSQPCASTGTCAQADADRIHAKLLVSDIAFGVGLVAAGVAVYLFITSSPSSSAKAADSSTVAPSRPTTRLSIDAAGGVLRF